MVTLKKIFLFTLLVVMGLGQSRFSFIHQDTSVAGLHEFYQYEAWIVNTSSDTLQLTTNRLYRTTPPPEWSASMCIEIVCLPPFIDVYDFSLSPGDSAWFALDIYPFEVEGLGEWSIEVIDSTTMEADTADISYTFGAIGVVDEPTPPAPVEFNLVQVFPNPTNAMFNTALHNMIPGGYELTLFDLSGRTLETRWLEIQRSGRYQVSWNVGGYTSGSYLLRVKSGDQLWMKRITIIK
ncbi:MAG: T9SS type A sorting domain-containing protein [Lentisphaeria bacterium]|nr:T9SS type A sorting domain-containing protein [Candidatus Neomarinimicrobiota bacterium]MCF7841602.1 T9SS type A sorting domain-containing protein [Lentisphaeria bacterium]